MGEGKGSSLVHLIVIVLSLVAFGFAIAAERRRSVRWMSFLVAEACLIAGAKKNAYHTKYRNVIYADKISCESLRKGIFIAGAVFVVATMILNVYYYMYFSKAITTRTAQKVNPAAGKTLLPWKLGL
ncbi:hypothetical protein OROGR_010269 [Orobanche gracilis]